MHKLRLGVGKSLDPDPSPPILSFLSPCSVLAKIIGKVEHSRVEHSKLSPELAGMCLDATVEVGGATGWCPVLCPGFGSPP